MDTPQSAAFAYAQRGWRVIPVHGISDGRVTSPGPRRGMDAAGYVPRGDLIPAGECTCGYLKCTSKGKHPLTQHGAKDASNDPLVIERWWRTWPWANVAIVCGPLSGIMALDIDGIEGETTLKRAAYDVPETLTSTTGRGRHLIYALGTPAPALGSPTGVLKGVDIRAGYIDGDRQVSGIIVAPPSMHYSGKRYEWVDWDTPVEAIPSWIVEMYGRGKKRAAYKDAEEIGRVDGGNRNNTLFSYASKWRFMGHGRGEILALLREKNAAMCQPPLDDAEVRAICESAMRYDAGAPTTTGMHALASDMVLDIQLDAARDVLKEAGVKPGTIDRMAVEMTKAVAERVERDKAEGVQLDLVRRSSGRGEGGMFDGTVVVGGLAAPLASIDGKMLLDYAAIRGRCLEEGVYLPPPSKDARKTWELLVEKAVSDAPTVDRPMEEVGRVYAARLVCERLSELLRLTDPEEFFGKGVIDTRLLVQMDAGTEYWLFTYEGVARYCRDRSPALKAPEINDGLRDLGAVTTQVSSPAGKRVRLRRINAQTVRANVRQPPPK